MTLGAEILHGVKWIAGAKLASQALTWGITLYVMRLLLPADYGLLAMATVFLGLLGIFAEVGLGPALVQATEINVLKMRQAMSVVWLVNLALCLLVNLSAPAVAAFYAEPRLILILRVMSLQFLISPFAVMPDVLLQRQLEFKQRSLIEFGTAMLGNLTTLALALTHFGVWSLVLGNIAGILLRTLLVNLVAPFRALPCISWTGMRALLSFGASVTASRFLWFCFTQADVVIVGRVLGEQVLGLYSVAMHLATLPLQRLLSILNQVAFPALARFQYDLPAIRHQVPRALSYAGVIIFPLMWGMSCTATEIVSVLLGPAWESAILPLQVLTLVMPFRSIVGLLPAITDAIGKPEVGLRNVLLGCATMPLAFYVGTRWGIAGVALAWLAVYPLVLYINLRRMLAAIGVSAGEVAAKLAPTILCAATMYLAVWLSGGALRAVALAPALALKIAIGVATYAVGTWLINRSVVGEFKQLVFGKT